MGKWVHRLSNIDTDKRRADCLLCGNIKIVSKGYGKLKCLNAYYEAHLRSKNYHRRNTALTNVLFRKIPKPDKCDLCGKVTKYLNRDHDHQTEKARGWLCLKCNLGLGNFYDDIEKLNKAIAYLTRPM